MKDKVTSGVANLKLRPLITYVHRNRGAIGEVVERLNKRTGKTWNRENVERWLHSDPEKRTQPLLGVGLVLIEIGEEMIRAARP